MIERNQPLLRFSLPRLMIAVAVTGVVFWGVISLYRLYEAFPGEFGLIAELVAIDYYRIK
jgi:hypothetical protein